MSHHSARWVWSLTLGFVMLIESQKHHFPPFLNCKTMLNVSALVTNAIISDKSLEQSQVGQNCSKSIVQGACFFNTLSKSNKSYETTLITLLELPVFSSYKKVFWKRHHHFHHYHHHHYDHHRYLHHSWSPSSVNCVLVTFQWWWHFRFGDISV